MAQRSLYDELNEAATQLMISETFYGHFFIGLVKQFTPLVPTMGVGPYGPVVQLYINPEFWIKRIPELNYRMGVLKHEILHLVFQHIFRSKSYSRKKLFNVACDLVVNQYIDRKDLPEGAVFLSLFPELKLMPDKDADYYYRKLSHLQDGNWEELGMDGPGDAPVSGKNLDDLLQDENDWLQRHAIWTDVEKLSAGERKVLEDSMRDMIRNSMSRHQKIKGVGDLPAGLREYLDAFERSLKPKVNWRRLLRLYLESSSRTYLKNTIRRPSKRYGTTPGIKIRRRQKVLVAIDTSGSVSQKELGMFFSEMYHIWKQGAEIMVVECDAVIQKIYPYQGKTPTVVHGRGGTDFTPPVVYANQKWLPDALIYFTDGYAGVPDVRSRRPIIWLVSSIGNKDMTHFPGRKIWLPDA